MTQEVDAAIGPAGRGENTALDVATCHIQTGTLQKIHGEAE